MKLAPLIFTHRIGSAAPSLQPGALALPVLSDAGEDQSVFGDGTHPTTRLCASAVDFLCRTRCPASVLDVGAGTGILARIARARGASQVWGTDIDPLALESMRAHAELDRSLVPIQISDQLPDQLGLRFDLVVANILEGPLHQLAPHIARALHPGGDLLLSGFTRLQSGSLQVAYHAQGLTLVTESHLDTWCMQHWRLAL